MAALTKAQQKYYNYLSAEEQRQKGSILEHSSFPTFILNCCGCFADLKTSSPKAARDFIKAHQGHKAFSMETNQRPNALKYDRDLVLEQIVNLGRYIVDVYPENGIVVKNTRITYSAIKNGIDIQGGLERLMAVYVTKNNFRRPVTEETPRVWLKAIMNQDHRLIKHLEGDYGINT